MTTPALTAAAERDAAAHELVGTVRALLNTAYRSSDTGVVTITLAGASLQNLVDTYNRAAHGPKIEASDVGR